MDPRKAAVAALAGGSMLAGMALGARARSAKRKRMRASARPFPSEIEGSRSALGGGRDPDRYGKSAKFAAI